MELPDNDVLELLDWRPEAPAWRAEWTDLYGRDPENGWQPPAPKWIAWAREALQKPVDMYGQVAASRILRVAEIIHPQGLERPRLQDALLALGRLHGRDYQPAQSLVDNAERQGIIRTEKIECWHLGMASGSGWRTFCRLTLYGKSLVEAAAMPDPFPPPQLRFTATECSTQPATNWFERARASQAKQDPAPQPVAPSSGNSASAIGDDFVWAAPFVDQQVRKFFRKHWDEYTKAIEAVLNEQTPMEQFALDFGPKRISNWVNDLLKVRADHPNPCAKQNVNASATYEALVKAFKRDPRKHAVVQRLQHGQSGTAQAILDEFLSCVGPTS